MKIYAEKDIETDSVEILLSHKELETLANYLTEFEAEIKQLKLRNKYENSSSFTHLHFKDCGLIGKNSCADIIFYVNLNEDSTLT